MFALQTTQRPPMSKTHQIPQKETNLPGLESLVVSQKEYKEWVALFDTPPQDNEKLRRALQTPLPWD
ncbi:MAG: hypothetical protein HQL93_04135 [Magnetococcales bacterium]|nr:hypothetical protein [Magnetococcales bacterium]